jgi:phosphohistidine swiveling domain-containing protein
VGACLLLASARGQRRLDPSQSVPNSLRVIPGLGRVLDWNLVALEQARVRDLRLVGGYHIEKMVSSFPGLRMFFHAAWQAEGAVGALQVAELPEASPLLIATDRSVFRREAVEAVLAAVGGSGVVAGWSEDSAGAKTPHDPALLALGPDALAAFPALLATLPASGSLTDLLEAFAAQGQACARVDLTGQACRVDAPVRLARFVFGTKAETLDRLQPLVKASTIFPQVRFATEEWGRDQDGVLARIRAELGEGPLVVRSAALSEDSWQSSQAGHFLSLLGVDGADPAAVADAVERVQASYAERGSADPLNQVLVQPQVPDTVAAGVLLTRKPYDEAPYYVVSVDRSTRTDGVTGGDTDDLITHYVPRLTDSIAAAPPLVRRLVACAQEVEGLVGHDRIDLEFAVQREEERIVLLQARPLTAGHRTELADDDLFAELALARDEVGRLLEPRVGLRGATNLLGNMPDWNPAEILGVAPRALAFSLYRHAITDAVWAEARAALGYADASHVPLVVGVAGRPYVQVQASFTSLLPADLEPAAADRIVDAAIAYLRANPTLHDKVEFEVIPTCQDLHLERFQARLVPHGATAEDLSACAAAHARMTGRILRGETCPIEVELRRLDRLEAIRQELAARPARTPWAHLEAARHLLFVLRRHGTEPFSILARYAFIALSLLKGLVARGVLGETFVEDFLAATPSVASDLGGRLDRVRRGEETLDAFLAYAGHLRPGTYDITSPTYAQAPDLYFGQLHGAAEGGDHDLAARQEALEADFLARAADVERLAGEAGLDATAEQVWAFAVGAIPGRERSKFEFTRSLSQVLEWVAAFGEAAGIARGALADLPLDDLFAAAIQAPHSVQVEEWRRVAALNAKRAQLSQSICLPDVIASPADLDCVSVRPARPNFITAKDVTAPPALLWTAEQADLDLEGKIALCPSADPGYDWLFSRGIAGLITRHGGVASHMAIRAAELQLPAAIGCGQLLFDQLRTASLVRLDCAGGRAIRVH